MRILFIFLDGVGLGDANDGNPFVRASLPTLGRFTQGQPWTRRLTRIETERATFVPTDACLGVEGRPQSATGQAAILTGVNVPQALGCHYGPRPTAAIRAIIDRHNLIAKLRAQGLRVGHLNAYPPPFFRGLDSGKRLLSSIQYALYAGGVPLPDEKALFDGQALSVDFTNEAWRTHLGYPDAPLFTPYAAGQRLAALAQQFDFALFDHWLTDYIGHRGSADQAVGLLERLDQTLAGLLDAWKDSGGLILITSDHGNIEDIAGRTHTTNPVPTLVIGAAHRAFAAGLSDLTHIAPRILGMLTNLPAAP
jgi:hypothetical protein